MLGVGSQTNLYKYAIEGYFAFLFVGAVFHTNGCYVVTIAQNLRCLRRFEYFDVAHRGRFVLQNRVGAQGIGKFKYCYVVTDTCKVDSCFDARITTTNYGHVLTFVERPIAVRAEVNALTHILRLIVYVKTSPTCAGSHNNGRCNEHLSTLSIHAFGRLREVYAFKFAVLEYLYGVVSDVRTQVVCKLCTRGLGYRHQVFDANRVLNLTANATSYYGNLQPLACRIDGGSRTSRPSAYNNEVELALNGLGIAVFFAAKHVFKLAQQFA